jgi:hypothetical protein
MNKMAKVKLPRQEDLPSVEVVASNVSRPRETVQPQDLAPAYYTIADIEPGRIPKARHIDTGNHNVIAPEHDSEDGSTSDQRLEAIRHMEHMGEDLVGTPREAILRGAYQNNLMRLAEISGDPENNLLEIDKLQRANAVLLSIINGTPRPDFGDGSVNVISWDGTVEVMQPMPPVRLG